MENNLINFYQAMKSSNFQKWIDARIQKIYNFLILPHHKPYAIDLILYMSLLHNIGPRQELRQLTKSQKHVFFINRFVYDFINT